MNLKAEVILTWGDGEYLFSLRGREIEELEYVCGKVGIAAIYQRVVMGNWFWSDLYHTVRLGLVGGGMGPVEAKRLTDMYIGQGVAKLPLVSGPNSPETVAQAILNAAFHGIGDLDTGEVKAGEAPAI